MFPSASKKKKGGAPVVFPDVCKTPAPPAPFLPIPYPNVQAASTNLKIASARIKKFNKEFEKSAGDAAGTLKGVTSSVGKIASIFAKHSKTVKDTGKKASKLMMPNQAVKVFKQAQKQQKAFEGQIKKECDKLLKECKDDKKRQKLAKTLVSIVGSAARGHPV